MQRLLPPVAGQSVDATPDVLKPVSRQQIRQRWPDGCVLSGMRGTPSEITVGKQISNSSGSIQSKRREHPHAESWPGKH